MKAAGVKGFYYRGLCMYFLCLGLILLPAKALAWGPVASWPWWLVLAPFALAVLWWTWADATGYTQRRVMGREKARQQARIDRHLAEQGRLGQRERAPARPAFGVTVQ